MGILKKKQQQAKQKKVIWEGDTLEGVKQSHEKPKGNTYQWFMEHTYLLDDTHDATNQNDAWKIGMDQERLALGVIYRQTGRPTYESLVREGDDMLFHRTRDDAKVRALVDSYVKK